MERKAIMYLDRGLVGYDAWVFYGFISFGARLFGSRDWDRGRAVDGHNCISCYSQPADNQATNVSDGVKAERSGGNDECNNEACTRGRPMEAARSFWTTGRFTNKGQRLYPPRVAYRESEFAKRISAYAGAARAHEALGEPMRTESQDYRGFEIQVAHNPPTWQVSISPRSPQVYPLNRALQRISCQIKSDAFAKARERIDEVLKAAAHKIPVAFGP
jgi:hypothetical protein